MRLEYPKTDPMNYIAKLLLNSLYGRFGMDDNFTINTIIPNEELNKFLKINSDNSNNIINLIDLDANIIIQSKDNSINNRVDNGSIVHNVNISIASAITAYASLGPRSR